LPISLQRQLSGGAASFDRVLYRTRDAVGSQPRLADEFLRSGPQDSAADLLVGGAGQNHHRYYRARLIPREHLQDFDCIHIRQVEVYNCAVWSRRRFAQLDAREAGLRLGELVATGRAAQ